MAQLARFLGFAFANADMLFEIDKDTNITFATGAMSEFVEGDGTKLPGKRAACLFDPQDGIKFITFAKSLRDGGRAGPIRLKLAGGRFANVSLCRLPLNPGTISCTLANPDGKGGLAGGAPDAKTGLPGRDGFLDAAAEFLDGDHALTLVDVPGLPDACAKLSESAADRLLKRIGQIVLEAGSGAAGRFSATTFGAIDRAGKPSRLAEDIAHALEEGGVKGVEVEKSLVNLSCGRLSNAQRLLALRHVVGRFAEGGPDAHKDQDLVAVFDAMIVETQKKAIELTDTILAGNFTLQFQPVVSLSSMTTEYNEALARFTGADDTGKTVAFAEQLGISDAFDVAVANKVLQETAANREVQISLNLSGLSLCSPSTFGVIAGLLAARRVLAGRVRIELTESSQISDLATANAAVQALRALGYQVGLDDFGAGASSFQYLHAFDVDFVKFDGSLVRNLGRSKREDTLVEGLVKLCGELGVATVAEGIEDAAIFERVRGFGFDYGQGYHLGKPAVKALPTPATRLGKRQGAKLTWT